MTTVDLNADLGESFGAYTIGNDAQMLKLVTSANIACGFHAGDPIVMHAALAGAKAHGVGVGAHPGLNDLWGFGRRCLVGEDPDDIEKMLIYQVAALRGMAATLDVPVRHAKLHGALWHMAAADPDLARAAARALKAIDRDLIFLVPPASEMARAAEALDLNLAYEVFADRAYAEDGTLVPRDRPGAVIAAAETAAARMVEAVRDGAVRSLGGTRLPMRIDSICVHGDTPDAVAIAQAVRTALTDAGISLRPLAEIVG